MVDSKAWNWDEVKEQIWNEPSEDVYYYLHRWQQTGFKKFLDLGCGKGRHSHLIVFYPTIPFTILTQKELIWH